MCRSHTSLLVIKRWHGALGTEEVGRNEPEIHRKWKQSDNPFRGMGSTPQVWGTLVLKQLDN
jgi:hypothetical protein